MPVELLDKGVKGARGKGGVTSVPTVNSGACHGLKEEITTRIIQGGGGGLS